jgi:hypothetical protein
MLGTDIIGTTTLSILSDSLANTTYANCDNGMREFAAFCHDEGIQPLWAIHAIHPPLHCAWLGLQRIVAAASQQQYYSALNKLFCDHQQQPIAVGELFADARRGIEM